MAQIDLNPPALIRLVQRLQREYGETSCSNFALDEQLNEALGVITQLRAVIADTDKNIAAFAERVQQMQADNEELREQLDPKRKGRFRGPHPKEELSGSDEDKSS